MRELADFWGDSPALLVVDMTRSLADPAVESSYECGIDAAGSIRDVLDAARARAVPVFFSKGGKRYHTSSSAPLTDVERSGWTNTNAVVERDSEEMGLAYTITPQLAPRDGEVVVEKTAPSAFFGTMLPTYLSSLRADTLVVCGMMTSGCVRATVTDAFSSAYRVVLPEGCLADRRAEAHELHVEEMGLKYATVAPTRDVVAQFDAG